MSDRRPAHNKAVDLKAELQAPGGVEGYVQQGRVPIFQGPLYLGGRRAFLCHVPPVGVQRGDSYERMGGTSDFMFSSPSGERRGVAEAVAFSPTEIEPVKGRALTALDILRQSI